MDLLSCQRSIFGFHGCNRRAADSVPAGKAKLSASSNTHDWLGATTQTHEDQHREHFPIH